MPEPISFPIATNTFSLPLLFTGQTQKEFFVNQSLTLIDSLLQGTVEGTFAAPPGDPADGTAFRVAAAATGEWTGHDGEIAVMIGGASHFIAPFDGMKIYDQLAEQFLTFRSGWIAAAAPPDAQGGDVIDVEARDAIANLSQALRSIGVLAESV